MIDHDPGASCTRRGWCAGHSAGCAPPRYERGEASAAASAAAWTFCPPASTPPSTASGLHEKYKPPADAKLNRPQDTAAAVLFTLPQPSGCEIKELVVASEHQSSWP